MLCPRCQIQFNAVHWNECPHCGDPSSALAELEGVVKTSTILISGDEGGVFSCIDDVPEPLRSRLASSTSGKNSGTIVIADRGGRERIAAALRSLPTRPGLPATPLIAPSDAQAGVRSISTAAPYWRRPQILWLGLVLAVGTGGLVWYIYSRAM